MLPFCNPDVLGVLECGADLVLSCTGPYGKGAELAVNMALCAATLADTAAGRRRRESNAQDGRISTSSALSTTHSSSTVGRATLPLMPGDRLRYRRDYEQDTAAKLFHASSLRVANMVMLMQAIFGKGNDTMASAYSPSFQRDVFLPAVLQSGPLGELFTQAELNTMLAANLTTVTTSAVENFALRWNNTVAAWSSGYVGQREAKLEQADAKCMSKIRGRWLTYKLGRQTTAKCESSGKQPRKKARREMPRNKSERDMDSERKPIVGNESRNRKHKVVRCHVTDRTLTDLHSPITPSTVNLNQTTLLRTLYHILRSKSALRSFSKTMRLFDVLGFKM